MLRYPMGLLTAGVLLLSVGAVGANALPRSEWVDRPVTNLDRVQFNDGGRCYNSCIAGTIFNQCQAGADAGGDSVEGRENCCNLACNRLNNYNYRPN